MFRQTTGRMCNVCLVFYLCAKHSQWNRSEHTSRSLCALFLHSFVFKVFPLLSFPSPFPFPLFPAIELPPFCTEIVYAILKLQLEKKALCGYFKLQSCHQMSACYISHNNGIFPIFQFLLVFPTKNCCTIFLFFAPY